MSITKRDFESLSEALCHSSPMFDASLTHAARSARMKQWRQDVHAVAAVLKLHNKRFDEQQFFKACELPPEVEEV